MRRGDTALVLRSPAKINLFLGVVGRRPDGYHDLISLMCPLTLADEVCIRFGDGPLTVACDHPDVPEDETNLALRAARRFMAAASANSGLEITIEKRIPVAAGLGGGSSNAAAVLTGLNDHFGLPLSPAALAGMAVAIGADVPFFLSGRPALATGIGEILQPVGPLRPYHVVLLCPPYGLSTAAVYKNLNLALTKCKKIHKSYPLERQDFDVARHLCNDLEDVAASMHPDIQVAKVSLLDHGASGALMSGSGPTVFGLFKEAEIARSAARRIAVTGKWRVIQTALGI
jgi:4-diphosphocytidyl-2-C-methyl-D-erythritol kinase